MYQRGRREEKVVAGDRPRGCRLRESGEVKMEVWKMFCCSKFLKRRKDIQREEKGLKMNESLSAKNTFVLQKAL